MVIDWDDLELEGRGSEAGIDVWEELEDVVTDVDASEELEESELEEVVSIGNDVVLDFSKTGSETVELEEVLNKGKDSEELEETCVIESDFGNWSDVVESEDVVTNVHDTPEWLEESELEEAISVDDDMASIFSGAGSDTVELEEALNKGRDSEGLESKINLEREL